MIGIPLGLLYSNVAEWWIHKHILHGLGKNRESFWSFHWHEHHAAARKNEMVDEQYTRSLWGWEPQTKELAALVAASVAHLPLLPVAPFFTLTVWYSAVNYYRVHKRSHLDHEWAKEHLPWHYDHHMGRNQNANWCVTKPWADALLGTRKRYEYGDGVPRDQAEPGRLMPKLRKVWRRVAARAERRAA
jgi:hypothetical protein